ncbi:MAG: WbqC family protein [Marinifilaceae bacterium]|jgi:hypothetical protein|nr:WbqC family protein [Marinifilaceae bacterium]
MTNTALLPNFYFGCIQYFCKILQYENIIIEQYESFPKQTYRNRCDIAGSNGKISLIVPVVKARTVNTLFKDVKISYDEDWQTQHLRSIKSCYQSSPFFEYYIDDIEIFFKKKYEYLSEFNLEICKTICDLIEIDFNPKLSDDFEKYSKGFEEDDYRFGISSKKSKKEIDSKFIEKEYYQVFSERQGFMPNISILDCLFNLGPETATYLRSCIA